MLSNFILAYKVEDVTKFGFSDVIGMIKEGVGVIMDAFTSINGNWVFLGLIVLVLSFTVIGSVIAFLKG